MYYNYCQAKVQVATETPATPSPSEFDYNEYGDRDDEESSLKMMLASTIATMEMLLSGTKF